MTFLTWLPQRSAPGATRKADGEPPTVAVKTIRRYPHDAEVRSLPRCIAGARAAAPRRQAFTQGLVFHRGELYESTGLYGSSSVRAVDFRTGAVLHSTKLEKKYFGEGLTMLGTKLFQLTWRCALLGTGRQVSARTRAFAGSTWCLSTISTCDKWEVSRWRRMAGESRRTAYR
jgi:hypothetical protein